VLYFLQPFFCFSSTEFNRTKLPANITYHIPKMEEKQPFSAKSDRK